MSRPVSRSVRLLLEGMEDRFTPANNLSVVSPIETTVNVTQTNDGAGTITISATGADAKLKITDIEGAMTTAGVTHVLITTADPNAPDGGQAGDIVWEVADTGDLDFAGFGTQKTLTFRSVGDIELTDLHFVLNGDANNHSSLEFDTSIGNGDVKFHAGTTNGVVFDEKAVSNLVVTAGTGTISYENTLTPDGLAYARALGDISFSGGVVNLANDDGVDAGGDIAVTGTDVQVGAPLVADGGITLDGATIALTSSFGLSAGSGVVLTGTTIQSSGMVVGIGDITVNGGTVALANIQSGRILPGGTIVSGGDITVHGTDVTLAGAITLGAGNDIGITASSVDLGGTLAANGDITVTGPVTLVGDVAIGGAPGDADGASTSIILAGTVDGAHKLSLSAVDVAIQQSIGGDTELTGLEFIGGDVEYAANQLHATTITIGDNYLPLVSFSGTGTLTGNVVVNLDATIRPGGDGSPGTLPIVGNLNFTGGVLDIELGPTNDLLDVTGNVTLSTSSSYLDVAGFIPNVADIKIVNFTGALLGHFLNAADVNKSPILTESDILTVSHYGPASTGITLAPFAVDFKAAGGNEFDGTGYVVRLIGQGILGAVLDGSGVISLATHGTTAASKIIVTTTANASDDIMRFANVFIHGSLGAFTAAKADAQMRVDGTIQSVSLHAVDGLSIGGLAANRTSLVADTIPGLVASSGGFSTIRVAGALTGNLTASNIGSLNAQSIGGDITVAGAITSINTTAGFTGDLSASSVGTVAIGTVLGQLGAAPADPRPTWSISGHIGTLNASGIAHFVLGARSMGTLNVTAKPKAGLGGHITDSILTLSGNTGASAGRMALKTVRVAGAVSDSLFDIEDGNVDAVTVGRFINSRLYLGYDPNGAFNTGGQFDINKLGKLNKFTTTATPLGQDFNPSNFAFVGSQVAANTFGKVLLSGLQTANSGITFGFKFHSGPGSVRVGAAGPGSIPLNSDLDPATFPVGNFYLVAG